MSGHEFRVTNEEDVLPARTLVVVAVVTALVFTVGGLAAWWILNRYDRAHRSTLGQPVKMAREINMIDQSLIWVDQTIIDWISDERRQLESYGWVDREKGIAHIPIDQAMDRVIRGQR